MTKLIALTGRAVYSVTSPVNHDRKGYKLGDPITLDTAQAQKLLDDEVITHAADQPPQGGTDGITELLADLDDRDTKLAQARQDIEALQATVTRLQQAAADQAQAHETELASRSEQLATENANSRSLQGRLDEATVKAEGLAAHAADLQAQLDKANVAQSPAGKAKTK